MFANEEHLCKIIGGQNKDLQDFQHPEKLGGAYIFLHITPNTQTVKRVHQLSGKKPYGMEVCKFGSESKGQLWHPPSDTNTEHDPFRKQFRKNNFIVVKLKIQTLSAGVT